MLLVEAHQVLRLEVVSPHLTGLVSLGLDDRCRLRLRTCIYTPAGTRRALSCSLGSAISRSLEPHLPVTVAHTVFTRVSGRSTVCSPVNDSMGKFPAASSRKLGLRYARDGLPVKTTSTCWAILGPSRAETYSESSFMTIKSKKAQVLDSLGLFLKMPGRGERIRTSGLYVPNVALYLAKLHPVCPDYGMCRISACVRAN